MAISLRAQYNYAEEEIVSLTANQYKCIDQLEDNPRCLIKGSAGTGKTLLAIESAKKYASCGEKVALFCYNNLLARWLQQYFEKQVESLRPTYVGTFHGYLMKVVQGLVFSILKVMQQNRYRGSICPKIQSAK